VVVLRIGGEQLPQVDFVQLGEVHHAAIIVVPIVSRDAVGEPVFKVEARCGVPAAPLAAPGVQWSLQYKAPASFLGTHGILAIARALVSQIE
jgi:hypothetical protein